MSDVTTEWTTERVNDEPSNLMRGACFIWKPRVTHISTCAMHRRDSRIMNDWVISLPSNEHLREQLASEWTIRMQVKVGRVWRIGRVGAFRPKGHGFDSCSSRYVGTLGKSFTHSCLWHFGVKFRHRIRVVSGALLSSSGLVKRCYKNSLNERMMMMMIMTSMMTMMRIFITKNNRSYVAEMIMQGKWWIS